MSTKQDLEAELEIEGWHWGFYKNPEDYQPVQCSDGIITPKEQADAFNKGVDDRYEYDADQAGDD